MSRSIAHIDLDSFFVSVERRANPSLLGKPVLIGGKSGRGVVASCSYEARKFGIHSAMPMSRALRLCPDAIVLSGRYSGYSAASAEVTAIIRDTIPVCEKTSIDEFYLDLSGMDDFDGCFRRMQELRQRIIRETDLPISFGFSTSKIVSKIATGLAKPNGEKRIEPGTERDFLAPLPVGKMPGIGKKTVETLAGLNIRLLGDIQKLDARTLQQRFGKHGHGMWERACGIDNRPVEPHSERKSISQENTFHEDVTDTLVLETMIASMTEHIASKLRREGKLSSCLTIKIRYQGFDTFTFQEKIALSAADHALIPKAREIFRKHYQKDRPVRLIGVRLSDLAVGNQQMSLFDNNEQRSQLYDAIDKINARFGAKTVSKAVSMDISNRTFNPFNGNED
ncbi:MAG: DNA polymerase IV [Mucilaginibacter polytrichastri]|nr:DNA polymerase IV [Mucilaginibacter polytrichastri]